MIASTREKILEKGLNLLSESGLSGVTLGVLADQAGMSKSGLFAHFRSKDDVQIALLDQSAKVAAEHVIAPAMQAPEGLPRVKALVNAWLGWPSKAGLRGGCPVAAALFELDDTEGRVRDKVVEMEAFWRALLTRLVREAIDHRHLRHNLDADQFVWELSGIYLIHHVSRRFLRDPNSDARAATAFEALLRRARPVIKKKR